MRYVVTVAVSAASFAVLIWYFRRRARESTSPWRKAARRERTIVVRGDLLTVEDRARGQLREVGEEREVPAQPEGWAIEVVTPSNWKTSGTVVRVALRETPEGVAATISAWPGSQLFDWGESKRVVQEVADRLG